MSGTYYDEWLQHHGVKGMKWGVRRFKNNLSKNKRAMVEYENASRQKGYDSARAAQSAKTKRKFNAVANKTKNVKGLNKITGKANQMYNKRDKKLQSNARTSTRNLNKAKANYTKALKATANLPIDIKKNHVTTSFKAVGKSAIAASINTGLSAATGFSNIRVANSSLSRTKRDRFISDVDRYRKGKGLRDLEKQGSQGYKSQRNARNTALAVGAAKVIGPQRIAKGVAGGINGTRNGVNSAKNKAKSTYQKANSKMNNGRIYDKTSSAAMKRKKSANAYLN